MTLPPSAKVEQFEHEFGGMDKWAGLHSIAPASFQHDEDDEKFPELADNEKIPEHAEGNAVIDTESFDSMVVRLYLRGS